VRFRVTDSDYIARLQRHLAEYKSGVLRVHESGSWGKPPRPYPHILPPDRRELNIVASFREAFWRSQRQRRWKLHKYFHHLSSSQALAFNILFPLYPYVPSGMAATRRILGLPEEAVCHVEFEAVLDAVEGTNIDALIETGEGTRTIVEVKLTERAFGGAREDERASGKTCRCLSTLVAGPDRSQLP
jgi:hypothetical protein